METELANMTKDQLQNMISYFSTKLHDPNVASPSDVSCAFISTSASVIIPTMTC